MLKYSLNNYYFGNSNIGGLIEDAIPIYFLSIYGWKENSDCY